MPKEYSRTQRIADAIQRELSQLIRTELRDPRVGLVSITSVEVSRDLSHAKVYVNFVTAPLDGDDHGQAIKALNGAAGFLRSQLANTIELRTTPALRFIYDATSEKGQKLSALIDYALHRDQQLRGDPVEDQDAVEDKDAAEDEHPGDTADRRNGGE